MNLIIAQEMAENIEGVLRDITTQGPNIQSNETIGTVNFLTTALAFLKAAKAQDKDVPERTACYISAFRVLEEYLLFSPDAILECRHALMSKFLEFHKVMIATFSELSEIYLKKAPANHAKWQDAYKNFVKTIEVKKLLPPDPDLAAPAASSSRRPSLARRAAGNFMGTLRRRRKPLGENDLIYGVSIPANARANVDRALWALRKHFTKNAAEPITDAFYEIYYDLILVFKCFDILPFPRGGRVGPKPTGNQIRTNELKAALMTLYFQCLHCSSIQASLAETSYLAQTKREIFISFATLTAKAPKRAAIGSPQPRPTSYTEIENTGASSSRPSIVYSKTVPTGGNIVSSSAVASSAPAPDPSLHGYTQIRKRHTDTNMATHTYTNMATSDRYMNVGLENENPKTEAEEIVIDVRLLSPTLATNLGTMACVRPGTTVEEINRDAEISQATPIDQERIIYSDLKFAEPALGTSQTGRKCSQHPLHPHSQNYKQCPTHSNIKVFACCIESNLAQQISNSKTWCKTCIKGPEESVLYTKVVINKGTCKVHPAAAGNNEYKLSCHCASPNEYYACCVAQMRPRYSEYDKMVSKGAVFKLFCERCAHYGE